MTDKLSAAEIVYMAITWAEESMAQMVAGCDADDPYRAEVKDWMKQMRAYRDRRFGKPQNNPFEGAKLINMMELRQSQQLKEPT